MSAIAVPSRLSRRITVARSRRRSRNTDQWYRTHGGASLDPSLTLSLGLGIESGAFRRP
jgi:hypothetical protein